jgi:hypothetical protein
MLGTQASFFDDADGNGDGMLNWAEAEAKGMDKATFKAIDADNNGTCPPRCYFDLLSCRSSPFLLQNFFSGSFTCRSVCA